MELWRSGVASGKNSPTQGCYHRSPSIPSIFSSGKGLAKVERGALGSIFGRSYVRRPLISMRFPAGNPSHQVSALDSYKVAILISVYAETGLMDATMLYQAGVRHYLELAALAFSLYCASLAFFRRRGKGGRLHGIPFAPALLPWLGNALSLIRDADGFIRRSR